MSSSVPTTPAAGGDGVHVSERCPSLSTTDCGGVPVRERPSSDGVTLPHDDPEPTLRKGDNQRSQQVAGTYVLLNLLLRKTEPEHDSLKSRMLEVVGGTLDPDTGVGPVLIKSAREHAKTMIANVLLRREVLR